VVGWKLATIIESCGVTPVPRMNVERIEHRAAKVSLVNGLSTILAVGFQLVSVPICLRYWGKETYGSWLALFSAFMLLRSLDGGYAAYVGNKLNYLYHKNTAALHEHLSSAVAGIMIIGCMQLALAAVALIFDPLSAMLGISPGHNDILMARLGLLALIISWVLSGSYLGIVHRLLIPAGLMYQAGWWAMEFQVAQFGAIMAAAMLRLDMLQTSLLFALTQLVSYVASALYVRHKLPVFSPWLQGAKMRVGVSDLGQSLFLSASNLIQQSAINGSVLLVSAMAGPVAVPIFTTVRTLSNLWTSVTTVLSTPLLPDVVRLHAKGETQKLVVINQAFWVLVGSAVNLGALLSYPLIPFLYGQWTGHTVVLDSPLLCLLLGSVVTANAGALMALHLNGINSLRIVLGASIARAVFSLGFGAVGYGRYGLTSFGLGILAGEIVATLMTARYFVKHEVTAKGSQIALHEFGPVSLSTGSVVLFFIGAGFGWWSVGEVWLFAIISVAAASIWGWKILETELQTRLKGMALDVFGR
jgi:O-antigen/teichoic acid export membrane protein